MSVDQVTRCQLTWDGPRVHVCRCHRHPGHEGRHVCDCGSWRIAHIARGFAGTDMCWHPQRSRTMKGDTICEMCERTRQGWGKCKVCKKDWPGKICDDHEDELVECPVCLGHGEFECDELNCHGFYCRDGWMTCDECGGTGEVVHLGKARSRSRKKAETVATGTHL